MGDFLIQIWAHGVYRKLILTTVVWLAAFVLGRLLPWLALSRLPDESPHIYVLRNVTTYCVSAPAILLTAGISLEHLGSLSVALGILAAGPAFALQKLIGSIAGRAGILAGRPFTTGDQIETGDMRGDLVDVSVLRTTLMEIGNWPRGDHNTGRIVTGFSAFIFKEPLFNYSRHLHCVWDEIEMPVTNESDWRRARQIMVDVVEPHPQYRDLLPRAQEQHRLARRRSAIKSTPLDPRVFVRLSRELERDWTGLSGGY
jgi:small-conductance mechanosensitive channel